VRLSDANSTTLLRCLSLTYELEKETCNHVTGQVVGYCLTYFQIQTLTVNTRLHDMPALCVRTVSSREGCVCSGLSCSQSL